MDVLPMKCYKKGSKRSLTIEYGGRQKLRASLKEVF